MGWSGASYIPSDKREFCRREISEAYEVLADAMVGSTWYAAVRRKDTGDVFAAITLTKMSRYQGQPEFCTKGMDETVGPYSYDCPKRILDLLTEPYNDHAREWRQKCVERRESKRAVKASGKFEAGAKLYCHPPMKFGDGREGHEFTVVVEKSKPWRSNSRNVTRFVRQDGMRCSISASSRHRLLTADELAEHIKRQAEASRSTVTAGAQRAAMF